MEDACGWVERNGAGSMSKTRAVVAGPGPLVGHVGERQSRLVGVRWSGSGRLPFVSVMKSADLRDRHDATIARRGVRARIGASLFSERGVRDCS